VARLPRATFALLLSLLPASATLIGVIVLRQIPSIVEIAGILLVACGVALHREAETLTLRDNQVDHIASGEEASSEDASGEDVLTRA
jgi:threonine/homoserine efflux transporter RhtA